ncbi:MAG: LysM peptidoglycan-binding domain-containing protein [Gammaproteobacteria bacterium]|nr:LysM peptidoglycan-binding domain-containing protein [Gammaproteobacteria bacterium]
MHDDRDLSIVYEALRFRSDTSSTTRYYEAEARKEHYRAILSRLAAGKRSDLSGEEARVLKLWPAGVGNATLTEAIANIRFQLGQSDNFREGLRRSGRWAAYIRHAFVSRGLPEELGLLPHVESSFNPDAYSKVGASGMWQFMPATGQRYLHIDHILDERLDPYMSTDAAAQLLALNYAVTGTWPLAITAYNHGAAGMRRAAQSLGTRDIATIVRRYQSSTFGFASRNFYLSFLAALEVHNDAGKYFPDTARDGDQPLRTVTVPDFMLASTLSRALNIEVSQLRAQNFMLMPPVWRGEKYVPAEYPLRLPQGAMDASRAARVLAAIPSTQRFAMQIPDEFHIVDNGDTLSGIASRYGASMSDLMVRNQLGSADFIRVGQRILLPASGQTSAVATTAALPVSMPADGRYRVQGGDTLSIIAARHGVTTSALVAMNDLRNANALRIGQVLVMTPPAGGASAPAAPAPLSEVRPSEAVVVKLEEAEPASSGEAVAATGDVLATPARPATTADPVDYEVAADGTIEVQAVETLGHYADWLSIPTQRLRDVNRLSFSQSVVLGWRLKLDFSEVTTADFTTRRVAYHRALQDAFFARFHIDGMTERQVRSGDSLWSLAQAEPTLPLWLLRQYNPDLDFANLQPGTTIIIPRLVSQSKLSERG